MRELLHCKLLSLPSTRPWPQSLCRGAAARDLGSFLSCKPPGARSLACKAICIQRKSNSSKTCKLDAWGNVHEFFSFSFGLFHYSNALDTSIINIWVKSDNIHTYNDSAHSSERPLEGARFCFHCMVSYLSEESTVSRSLKLYHSGGLLDVQRLSKGYENLRFVLSLRPRMAYSCATSRQSQFIGFAALTSFRDGATSNFIRRRKFRINAEKQKRSWWKQFLFESISVEDFPSYENSDPGPPDESEDDDEGTASETVASNGNNKMDEIDRMLADDKKFSQWKQKADAMNELRESQDRARDSDNKNWEDWLDDSWKDYSELLPGKDSWYQPQSEWEKGGLPRNPPKVPERGMNRTVRELFLRFFEKQEEVEEDLAFEERVFIFTTQSTVKFVACLVLVPWFVGFIVHDYAVVPFLNRYVEKVPLAAKALDVRESQKLRMIETLKLERQRVRLEAAIGKAPPLTDMELTEHIRDEARKLREEVRAENRNSFANIWSDLVAGVTLLLLLAFNPNQVAIMKLTGDRLFTNISDTGKAFIIILLSDIFLGYHSESGWETVIEIFLEHYGFEVDQASIYVFVAIVPVTIDACFKLWVFRYLTRLSASAAATFRAMKRH
ncbi:hypothetical protein O6H91_12G014700 [Diphasiastrum complanatum]|uniref:Uncharacterized protein n=1 Tax=Diphasiastrum complanatum TaxID=34168 RepID=A0ACC2BZ18_DIPCM|nr:hypothetical protein O6H91_12G014700 [Diphasiastrum complanatum]